MVDDTGVSPVVGTILVLGIFISVTGAVIFVAKPQFDELREDGVFQGATTDMAKASADLKQLAVTGARDTVKKPVITLSQGTLTSDDGHGVAVVAGYADADYGNVAGTSMANGTFHDFDLDDWEDLGTEFTIVNLGPEMPIGFIHAAYFDRGEWKEGANTTVGNGMTDTWAQDEAVTLSGLAAPFDDNFYRIQIYRIQLLPTPSTDLVGEIFVYEQDRIVYRFEGASGTRQLYLENGALFSLKDNRYRLEVPGLVQPPVTSASGQPAFTYRAAQLNATDLGGGGYGSVALLLQLQRSDTFSQDRGAVVLRVEYAGEYPVIWQNYLDREGFAPAWPEDEREGVVFWTGDDSEWDVFPYHFVRTVTKASLRPA